MKFHDPLEAIKTAGDGHDLTRAIETLVRYDQAGLADVAAFAILMDHADSRWREADFRAAALIGALHAVKADPARMQALTLFVTGVRPYEDPVLLNQVGKVIGAARGLFVHRAPAETIWALDNHLETIIRDSVADRPRDTARYERGLNRMQDAFEATSSAVVERNLQAALGDFEATKTLARNAMIWIWSVTAENVLLFHQSGGDEDVFAALVKARGALSEARLDTTTISAVDSLWMPTMDAERASWARSRKAMETWPQRPPVAVVTGIARMELMAVDAYRIGRGLRPWSNHQVDRPVIASSRLAAQRTLCDMLDLLRPNQDPHVLQESDILRIDLEQRLTALLLRAPDAGMAPTAAMTPEM